MPYVRVQVCYAPLALIVPPALLLVHQQLSLLYQIWIHTETVTTLGPLDYVFNTPAHHRVHHGRLFRRVWIRHTVLAVGSKQKKIRFQAAICSVWTRTTAAS